MLLSCPQKLMYILDPVGNRPDQDDILGCSYISVFWALSTLHVNIAPYTAPVNSSDLVAGSHWLREHPLLLRGDSSQLRRLHVLRLRLQPFRIPASRLFFNAHFPFSHFTSRLAACREYDALVAVDMYPLLRNHTHTATIYSLASSLSIYLLISTGRFGKLRRTLIRCVAAAEQCHVYDASSSTTVDIDSSLKICNFS